MFSTNIAAGLLNLGEELEDTDSMSADKEVGVLVPSVEDIEVGFRCEQEVAQVSDLSQLLDCFECFLNGFEVCLSTSVSDLGC